MPSSFEESCQQLLLLHTLLGRHLLICLTLGCPWFGFQMGRLTCLAHLLQDDHRLLLAQSWGIDPLFRFLHVNILRHLLLWFDVGLHRRLFFSFLGCHELFRLCWMHFLNKFFFIAIVAAFCYLDISLTWLDWLWLFRYICDWTHLLEQFIVEIICIFMNFVANYHLGLRLRYLWLWRNNPLFQDFVKLLQQQTVTEVRSFLNFQRINQLPHLGIAFSLFSLNDIFHKLINTFAWNLAVLLDLLRKYLFWLQWTVNNLGNFQQAVFDGLLLNLNLHGFGQTQRKRHFRLEWHCSILRTNVSL